MKISLLLIILIQIVASNLFSQSLNVSDLLSVAAMQSRSIDKFMSKNGFVVLGGRWNIDTARTSFIQKIKKNRKDFLPVQSVDIYRKDSSRYFSFHTSSSLEFIEGQKYLVKKGFVYDTTKVIGKDSSMFFQKWNMNVTTVNEIVDSVQTYTFILEEKKIPTSIMYAEDLLRFDSHEFLVSYFGEQNVKKDLYYFSQTELKKCSVLFGNSNRQVVFVWNDENNLNDLAFIMVSDALPTVNSPIREGLVSNNEWKLKCGMHPGMSLTDLIKLNENDFKIYGNSSELGLMIKPEEDGKINFKKTAVMLSCKNCNNDNFLQKQEVSALAVAKQNLPMYVFDIILYPSAH